MIRRALLALPIIFATSGAYAQPAKEPVYIVSDFEVTDPTEFKKFVAGTTPLVKAHEGVYLSRMNTIFPGAGEPPKNAVIIQFPSMYNAQAFLASKEYKALVPIRDQSAKFHSFVLQGGDLAK